ncbi:FecR family protein [Parvibium lacunae]|uniref:FecR protein domain-containing protein n=1 Tax=Parvibium lacunae TaxID=1888893 RepID=A0A368L671_9BURK|nr:FecR domain-containing protein [Parvibium lacunae]RCS58650.1 hypothetical protein DU000_07575 [Parvibium lacunae]
MPSAVNHPCVRFFAAAFLALSTQWLHANPVGEIEYVRGSGVAQFDNAAPRLLSKGLTVVEGDVISTGPTSFAVLKLNDGTRMTVRPDSSLRVKTFRFQESMATSTSTSKNGAQTSSDAGASSMVLQLLKGGLRTITGLLPKQASGAARIETPTATIGIRGTDFDARLCQQDCARENTQLAQTSEKVSQQVSARVVQLVGEVMVTSPQGEARKLALGGPLYVGDLVETRGRESYVVLAFRDDSRLSIQPNTRLRLEQYVYDQAQPAEGRFLVNLLRGGLRALTGLIARANPNQVAIQTRTATIGIRGTGFDVDCQGSCAADADTPPNNGTPEGLTTHVWLGSVVLQPRENQFQPFTISQGQTAQWQPSFGQPQLLPAPLGGGQAPRPDTLPVNLQQLFGLQQHDQNRPGLYVVVRDGHVVLTQGEQTVDLGKGEIGYVGDGRVPLRPDRIPVFLEFDRIPQPNQTLGRNIRLQEVMDKVLGPRRECR